MNASEIITFCRDSFRPMMDRYGFNWQEGDEVDLKGNSYAWGQYVNGDRKLRFAFGPQICLVRIHLKELDISIGQYFKALSYTTQFFDQFEADEQKAIVMLKGEFESLGREFLEGSVAEIKRTLINLRKRSQNVHAKEPPLR